MNLPNAQKYNASHATDVTAGSPIFAMLVEGWQLGHGISPDGQLGPVTRNSLLGATPAPIPDPVPSALLPPIAGPSIKMVDWTPGLTVELVEERWRRISKLPIEYVLGAGGRDPRAIDPRATITRHDVKRFGLDCTGAGNYCYGMDRYQENFTPYGGWMNTDAIVADARGKQEIWELLHRPIPGCALVFPGIDFDSDGDRERIGHFAYVSSVPAEWDVNHPIYRDVVIWDCAGSNSKLPGSVGDVMYHKAGYFDGKATYKGVTKPQWATIAVWCKAIERP